MQSVLTLSKKQKLKLLNQKLETIILQKQLDPKNIMQIQVIPQKSQIKQSNLSPSEIQPKQKTKKTKRILKKTLRKAAGVVWEDKTMEQWAQNDYRIFCGNIGKEVSDQTLSSVFRRYKSFQKARVVQDRRTGKNRGYGFVSFEDPKDFLAALKQMNGTYVGNRPIKVMKSSWKQRQLGSQKNKYLPSDFKSNSQKETNKICINYKYVSQL